MKKIISLLMALIFVFSMAAPSFAAVAANEAVVQSADLNGDEGISGPNDLLGRVVEILNVIWTRIVDFFRNLFGFGFRPGTYNVIYYTDETKTQELYRRPTLEGSEIEKVDIPTRVGYTFKSWVPALPSVMPAEDIEVYATWSIKTVTIKFDSGNPDYKIPDIKTTYGSTVILPDAIDVDKQVLIGWKDSFADETYLPKGAYVAKEDITLIGVWGVKETTLTFDPNGGYFANPDESVITQKAGEKVTRPNDPVRPGYKFEGWDGVIPANQPSEDRTFTAIWVPLDITTTWVSDGKVLNTQTTKCGEKLSPKVSPVPEAGYKFAGWKSNINGVVYSSFPIDTPSVNTTFTAQFTPIEYNYVFKGENGMILASGKALCGNNIVVPVAPSKTGHVFNGWVDATGTVKIAAGATTVAMQAGDATYTATYAPNPHTITWDANGGKVNGKDTDVTNPSYGSSITAPTNVTKTGYVFGGWLDAAGNAVPATMPDRDLSFTAVWNAAGDTKYTIETYIMGTNGQYGTPSVENKTGVTGAVVETTADGKEGFTFNSGKSVLSGTIAANGSLVLKVYYDRNKYNVTVNGETKQYYFGETIKAPAAAEKEGNTFKGWKGSDGKLYAAGADVTVPAQDGFTLTPEFTPNKYTITFKVNETVYQTLTFEYDAEIILPADPIMADKYFEGWTPALPTKMPANNLTVSANFTAATTHKVTFHSNGKGVFKVKDEFGNPVATNETTQFNVRRGDKINCPDAPECNEGYRFIGWALFNENGYTEKDVLFTGIEDAPKMTYSRDIFFYAVYVVPTCEITYILDGAELTDYTSTVETLNVVDPSKVVPEEKIGYDFSGWKILSINGKEVERDKDGNLTGAYSAYSDNGPWTTCDTDETVVYVGNYVAREHDVVFNAGEGYWKVTDKDGKETTVTEKIVKTKYNSLIEVPASPVAPKGMKFLGWTTDTETENLATITNLTDTKENGYSETKVYNYYAVYVIDEYEIRFVEWNADPKEDETETQIAEYKKVLYYGDAINISAYDPSDKPGYAQNEEEGFKPAVPAKITRETLAELSKYEGVVTSDTRDYEEYGVTKQYDITVITFTVVYEPLEFKISFSGCSYLTTKVPCDAKINDYVNAIPQAEGKTFVRWTDGKGNQYGSWSQDSTSYDLGIMPPNHIELHAEWKLNTYTIKFDTGVGGTKIEPVIYEFGAKVATPADPVRTGYTFAGWEPSIPATMPAKDVTVVAKWTAHDITISFDTDGGQPATIAPVTQKYGSNFTAPAAPTKTGHTFLGWLSSNGNTYKAKDTFQVPANNITLTAKWEVNNYSVVIDTNGGTQIVGNYIDVPYGTPVNEKITKDGHKLAGWYGWLTESETEADGVYYSALPSTVFDANMTYKAVWDCVDHNIYFHPKSIPMDDPETEVNEMLTEDKYMITLAFDCNANIVTPTEAQLEAKGFDVVPGKVIAGWIDLTGAAIPAKMTYEMVGKHYAVSGWEDALYTVTFDTNGGSDVAVQEVILNGEITEPAAPTKEGYTFKGWTDEKGYEVDFTEIVKLLEPKDVTFKAVWEANEYTVTWDIDGVKTEETYKFGAAIKVLADPVKEGYTFTGWSPEVPATMGAADATYTATWEVNAYKATFDPNGGVLIVKDGNGNEVLRTDEPYTMSINFGNDMQKTAPTLETREGYVFSGWVDAEDKQPMPSTMPAKNVTFNALWSGADGVNYTVKYYGMDTTGAYPKTESGEDIPSSTATFTGKTGTIASVTPTELLGFTVDTGMSNLSGEINADGSLVLNVYYSRNQYNLITVVDGVETATKYYYEAIVSTPVLPADTKEIDYPDAWTWSWTDGNGAAVNYQPATMPATDVKASVTSGPMYYTITLYSAGDIENPRVPYGTQFDVATLGTPKMDGYTFKNWTDADENGNVVTKFTVTEDVKLYANYSAIVYTATFYNSDPATNVKTGEALGTKQIAYGNVVTYNAPTAPAGYSFKGWLADGEIYDGKTDTMPAENMEFVAQWTAVTE